MSQTAENKATGTHSAYELQFKREPSNLCGVTMSASVEGNAIAELMSKKPGIRVTRYPAIIRIDAEKMIEFDMDEIGAALGYEPGEYDVYDFEVETSTHYGRQVRLDDRVLLFANPEDAAEYLGFEPEPTTPSQTDSVG
ncbi:MAG TPA: MmoB/DmpM family protein [Ktedonobacteraceae bacterium]|nr:MmoB/DmpM family protein [Ktedonobacteraceae bacterium]